MNPDDMQDTQALSGYNSMTLADSAACGAKHADDLAVDEDLSKVPIGVGRLSQQADKVQKTAWCST